MTARLLRLLGSAVFAGAFVYLCAGWITGSAQYAAATLHGHGLITDLRTPLAERRYDKPILALIWTAISVLTLWEIGVLVLRAYPRDSSRPLLQRLGQFYGELSRDFQPTFLAALVSEFLPRLIAIDVFWRWQPAFAKLAWFKTDFRWYSWVYAWLAWELTTWIWHFSAHKVRLLWCLHSPHHAPNRFNITVAWVHFFAEGYFTAPIQIAILMLLGVQPQMLLVIMAFEVAWGTLVHASEASLKDGRFGPLRHLIITPAYHRVHHAKNPLYMDTNFCTMLIWWDWLFGTLQPPRSAEPLEYGITRSLDSRRFLDFYFGEFRLLYRDLRSAHSWREFWSYLLRPPGWSPGTSAQTASSRRREFLSRNPSLALGAPHAWLLQRLTPPPAVKIP